MIVATFFMSPSLRIGGEEVGRLQELILGDAGDALDHLRRVARVLLREQLEYASRMLQRQVVRDVGRQDRGRGPDDGSRWPRRCRSSRPRDLARRSQVRSARASRPAAHCRRRLAASGTRLRRRRPRAAEPRAAAAAAARVRLPPCFIVPGRLVVHVRLAVEPGVQPILRQLESFLYDEGGVRIVDEIVVREVPVGDARN